MSAQHTPGTHLSANDGRKRRTRRRAPKPGSSVKVTFGGFAVKAVVVRQMITGRFVVDMDVTGVDEPVQGLFTIDEMQPVDEASQN